MHCFSKWGWLGRLTMLLLLVFALSSPFSEAASAADGGIQVTRSEAKQAFPDSITFVLSAGNTTPIDQVTLIYGVETDSCLNSQARQVVKIKPSNSINADWLWDLKRSGNLPPGVKIWWQWEIHALVGKDTPETTLTTDVQEITIEDRGFTWKKLSRGKLTLYWAEGDYAFGQRMLEIATSSLDRLGKDAGLKVDKPIEMRLYPSAEDLRGALVRSSEWVGGVAFPEYNISLIGLSPTDDPSWAPAVIPHELAHLVTGMRTFNCLNSGLPHWFNEGLSKFAEGPLPENELNAVLDALKRDTLPNLTSLNDGFPADSQKADLAYRQSRVIVSFVIEQYGPKKLEELLDQIRNGTPGVQALRSVYGLDVDELDKTWRAGQGYGSAPAPSFATRTSAVKSTAIPTVALWSPFSTPTSAPSPVSEPTGEAGTDIPTETSEEVSTATLPAASTAVSAVGTVEAPRAQLGGSLWLVVGGAVVLLAIAAVVFFVIRSRNQPKS